MSSYTMLLPTLPILAYARPDSPDDVPAHPYAVAMEVASLAPYAETTICPWKDTPKHIDQVVDHARRFLKAHVPLAPNHSTAAG